MAIQIDSLSILGLRKAHLRQLAEYIRHRDVEGWHYGPKEQFEARHADLIAVAESIEEICDDSDVRIATRSEDK